MIKKLKKYSLFAFCAMLAGGCIISVHAASSHTQPAIPFMVCEDNSGSDNGNSGNNDNNGDNNNRDNNNNGSDTGTTPSSPGEDGSIEIPGDDTPL